MSMTNQQEIITYLKDKYKPLTIALYGSYAEGTNDQSSDFDCLIIVQDKDCDHDASVVAGVPLDCYIYTEEEIEKRDIAEFITLYEADLVYDSGLGKSLKSRVQDYVRSHTCKDKSEKQFLVSWIKKTMKRMKKSDTEGNFRAIAFLAESLEDYYSLRDQFYFGSKKAIQYLKKEDKKGFELFHKAITTRSNEVIIEWGNYIIDYEKESVSNRN